ncbi:MAG TPA: DUF5694 domain-containing protein [Vicinamibacterales bacterium]|nr:DUF5694 domain-containing protein [Vicinamibacterales bacterium]
MLALAIVTAVPLTAAVLAGSVRQAPRQRAEVLVLGVYHMNNPGLDVFNMQADDVSAPKRQAEIAVALETLRKFAPTKIAVERMAGDSRIGKDFEDYAKGLRPLTRNETEQLGFRLAKELGHKRVYPVDVPGEFPFGRVANFAKANGRAEEWNALMQDIGRMVKAQDAYLGSHTILETLLHMNSDEKVAEDMGLYFRQGQFGNANDPAGADLVSAWFHRNMRIYSNIVGLIESPAERILVIYGAGHLGWLRQSIAGSPNITLRKLAEFAPGR